MRMAKSTKNPRLYRIWSGMKQRCFNKNATCYHRYGGRGITVCEEWKNSFQDFQTWALSNGYADDLTIDRINNNGNYCPENCRWVTLSENVMKVGRERFMAQAMKNPICFYRLTAKMTRKQLSETTGISIEEITLIDDRVIKPSEMTAKNLLAIADTLGVDPHILLEG